MAADLCPPGMLVAGGTDLYPKRKRRQFDPDTLVGLSHLKELDGAVETSSGFRLGSLVTLADAAEPPELRLAHPGYVEAAALVSSPPLRNAGTIGGNLCVDTRCNYYDMTFEWRQSVGFCLQKAGDICLGGPGSPRCRGVSP